MRSTDAMVWGLVAHLVADWPLQNDWMADNKADLRHPAGYAHAAIHGLALAPAFRWRALPLALSHLLIDTRKPVAWWSRTVGQKQPEPSGYGMGTEVRIWTDQVFHVAAIAIAALSFDV